MDKLKELIGNKIDIFLKIKEYINNTYEVEEIFDKGYKEWINICRYRKAGKTLCTFCFKENCIGIMFVFGALERDKVENIRGELSTNVISNYDNANTYHDGKWVLFLLDDLSDFEDIKKLLIIKRKPNKKVN